MSAQIPAAVLGATGYVGGELLRLLAVHPGFAPGAAVSDSRAGDRIADVFPHLASLFGGQRFMGHDDFAAQLASGSGFSGPGFAVPAFAGEGLALFSAAPHGASARLVAGAIATAEAINLPLHVVDVSADFRYRTASAFETVYGEAHGAPELLAQFSSGLPEHVEGTPSRHVGHPGCFATAMLLAAVPLLGSGLTDGDFFISGVTGSTGSGRVPQAGTHHPERHSNLYAYKALEHRHVPEVMALAEQVTGRALTVHFVPHSGPFARGIYVSLQSRLRERVDASDVRAAFDAKYNNAAFIDVLDGTPALKNVVASNRAHIGIAVRGGSVAVTCAIDNLVKGAAGGAVQWMNRLWGLPENSGLLAPAPAWT